MSFIVASNSLYTREHESRFAYSFLPGALFVALLCLINLLSYLTAADLVWLGVRPRNVFGLVGVVTGPLIHGDLLHLFSNSFPLLLLSGFILFMHRKVALNVFTLVYVLSGLFTWFVGRSAYHIGASGVVYGLAGYLLFNGLVRRDRGGLAISLAILFLYGGLFHGLFPGEERISWEGHLGGFIAGLVASIAFTEDRKKEGEEQVTEDGRLSHPHMSSTVGYNATYFNLTYTTPDTDQQKAGYTYTLVSPPKPSEKLTSANAPASK